MWNSAYLMGIIKMFLPPMAEIIILDKSYKTPAVGMVDLDGDGILELVGAYNWQGENYIIVLKYYFGTWRVADMYPDYFKKVADYYKILLKQMDSPVYWYYLADANLKAGNNKEALEAINKALSFKDPYPSREELMKLKSQICQYNPISNQNGIDFSSLKYICSEKERDVKLERALIKEFGLEQYEDNIRYYYNKIDLNGDGTKEVFAYLVGPIVCGTGGCSAAIFKDENGEYKLLTKFTLVNNPIIISNNKTNGYKDIIMNVYGGGVESFFALLKYNGTKYPSNPSTQPKVQPGTKVEGVAIISDDITQNTGIPLKPSK
ncbi:tetratricopeptide repeat protein [Clostridium sp. Marseille-Q2269]|uniref:tetratricopeptide repeat protein n=1 Tax=Clostridium sp. Marseille-Q2269 TaxID=2942205 RepID=UPI002072F48D|nr:tetratricopeptide repeat protein [Clostridium sp. Marseille-Q2269]